MKHFTDLPFDKIYDFLTNTTTLSCSDKMDGSFIKIAIDENGKKYVQRKDNVRRYTLDDWPDRVWTNDFKLAHIALFSFVDSLHSYGFTMHSGDYISFEMIAGNIPNSVIYKSISDSFFVIDYNLQHYNNSFKVSLLDGIRLSTSLELATTKDGKVLESKLINKYWEVVYNSTFNFRTHDTITPILNWLHESTEIVFDQNTVIQTVNLTRLELLKLNLNAKPNFITTYMIPWNKQTKETLKEIRNTLRKEFRKIVRFHFFYTFSSGIRNSLYASEGIVFKVNNELVKITSPYFTDMNRLSHFVRYNLIGGQRPPKSHFLSRTKNWTIEQKIKRLDVLLDRYLKYRDKLILDNNEIYAPYTLDDVHTRTLLLFAELRMEILNGR